MAAVKLSAYDEMLKESYTAIINAENNISDLILLGYGGIVRLDIVG